MFTFDGVGSDVVGSDLVETGGAISEAASPVARGIQ
jgi:predicted small secreted protein